MLDEMEGRDLDELPLGTGRRVTTIQSDKAKEFESRTLVDFSRSRTLVRTTTKGYHPVANGTEGRVVGILKSGLRKLLSAAKFPVGAWGYLLQ